MEFLDSYLFPIKQMLKHYSIFTDSIYYFCFLNLFEFLTPIFLIISFLNLFKAHLIYRHFFISFVSDHNIDFLFGFGSYSLSSFRSSSKIAHIFISTLTIAYLLIESIFLMTNSVSNNLNIFHEFAFQFELNKIILTWEILTNIFPSFSK